jgi:hydrogenase nickel incorporation protein HypA/HybF
MDAGAKKIAGVEVWIGALSQMSPEHFREHFEVEVRGTIAEGAALTIASSNALDDPQAQSVVLRSVELQV